MAFFKPRSPKKTASEADTAPAAPALANAPAADSLTRRARHRLIGAAILVVAAVIGLPWLFDAPPPTVSPTIPIVMDGKTDAPTATASQAVAVAPKAPATTSTPATQVALGNSLGDNEQVVDSAPASAAQRPAPSPTPAAAPPAPTPPRAAVAPTPARTAQNTASTATPARRERPEPARSAATPRPAPREQAPAPSTIDALIAQKQAQNTPAAPSPAEAAATKPNLAAANNFPETGRFVVQVGAYVDDAKLADVRKKLSAAGLNHYTQRVALNGKPVVRVRLGPFASRKQMEQAAAKVRALGLPVSQYQL